MDGRRGGSIRRPRRRRPPLCFRGCSSTSEGHVAARAGLRWSDVDLETGRLSIAHPRVLVDAKPESAAPKTSAGRRTVPLSPRLVAAMAAHRRRQLEDRMAWGEAWSDTGFVFTKEDGAPLHPEHLSTVFERHVRRAGLRMLRLHDTRHTCVSLALQAGEKTKHETPDPGDALDWHVRSFFEGHPIDRRTWPSVPMERLIPGFFVYRIAPGHRDRAWTFVTSGCWRATVEDGHGFEFVFSALTSDDRHVEILTLLAYYHASGEQHRLGIGHTVAIGEPWLTGSSCDSLLVSLPYPYGPDLESCEWATGHARVLWVMPITASERAFAAVNGLEALEQKFDDAAVFYLDARRAPDV
jgi:hypothetical protein